MPPYRSNGARQGPFDGSVRLRPLRYLEHPKIGKQLWRVAIAPIGILREAAFENADDSRW